MDISKNGGRLFKEAKTYKADEVEEIISVYGPGGPWYTLDWRGKKGEKPRLENIRETWGTYTSAVMNKHKTAPKTGHFEGEGKERVWVPE